MPRGGRKRRSKFCFPSCFSSPSIWDPEELEFPQEGLPLSYLSRLRSLSRTIPLEEITGNGGDVHVEVLGELETEDSLASLSPAGNKDNGLVQKFRKDKKSSLPHSPLSIRTHNKAEHQPSPVCQVSTNRSQHLAHLHYTRDPVQTIFRMNHPVTTQPNRTAAPAPSPTRSSRRLDPVIAVLMLSATLTVMLFFGRLCAVLCNCAWFYLLSGIPPPPMPPPPAKELSGVEELNVDSPAYKKKVVLMGLLERNRYGFSGMPMTPMASPMTARLIR